MPAYTLAELDALRDAAREWYGLHSNFDARELEERVRTLMTNGTRADELRAAISKRNTARRAAHARIHG